MNATPEKRNVNMRLPQDMIDQMQALAALHRRSFSGEVEWALSHYLETQNAVDTSGHAPAAIREGTGTYTTKGESRDA